MSRISVHTTVDSYAQTGPRPAPTSPVHCIALQQADSMEYVAMIEYMRAGSPHTAGLVSVTRGVGSQSAGVDLATIHIYPTPYDEIQRRGHRVEGYKPESASRKCMQGASSCISSGFQFTRWLTPYSLGTALEVRERRYSFASISAMQFHPRPSKRPRVTNTSDNEGIFPAQSTPWARRVPSNEGSRVGVGGKRTFRLLILKAMLARGL